ncbi:MAG: hypothetical protein KIH69_017880 [Anaerolineae bacterium]|nr:hypothetical protein [Anaerolineae bacterium]
MSISLFTSICSIAERQRAAILLVGGAVRDMLLGKPVHDYDISVLGDAIRLARQVANQLGGAFYLMDVERGIARVIFPEVVVDFAACRGDSWLADLQARDFTVNAIGLDVAKWRMNEQSLEKSLFDPLQGGDDLRQKRIRMCAPTAISDDPVRALRAIRMATVLHAELTQDTHAAVASAQLINGRLSIERLRDELMKILALPDALVAVRKLLDFGLLQQLLPHLAWQDAHPLNRVLQPIDFLPAWHLLEKQLQQETSNERTRFSIIRLAVILRHAANPNDGLKMAQSLRLSNDEMQQIRHILVSWPEIAPILQKTGVAQERLFYRFVQKTGKNAPELIWLMQIMQPDLAQPAIGLVARYFDRYAPNVAPPPLLQGGDLMAMGHTPGPHFGKWLDTVREAQMIGQIHTRAEAIELVQQLSASQV